MAGSACAGQGGWLTIVTARFTSSLFAWPTMKAWKRNPLLGSETVEWLTKQWHMPLISIMGLQGLQGMRSRLDAANGIQSAPHMQGMVG